MNKPETVADVLADAREAISHQAATNGAFFPSDVGVILDRIERAMAASAVPVVTSFDREHAADIVSHLVNSHTSAWIAGEKVSAAVAAHSRQYCKQAMVEAANLLEQLISAPPAVPVESLDTGNLADDPLYKALDALYERGWEDYPKKKYDPRGTKQWDAVLHLFRAFRDKPAPPLASVPDALNAVASHLRGEDLAEGLPDGWEQLADYEEIPITLNVRTIRAVIDATTPEPRT